MPRQVLETLTIVEVEIGATQAADPAYRDWDRGQWVGVGQEPADRPKRPVPIAATPRWTKWEWIGEGQGRPGPRRGLPAEWMPDGDNELGGHRHNPGVQHWADGAGGVPPHAGT